MDFLQSIFVPILADGFSWALLGALMWIGRLLPSFIRRRIEAIDRDAVERAAETAAKLIFAAIRLHPTVAIADHTVSAAADALVRKMPGVVRRLAPTQKAIEDMIRSRVQAKVDEALDRDRLTEELKRLGLDAQRP